MRIIWTLQALADLESIGDYIARSDAMAADRLLRQVRATATLLEDFPASGRAGRVVNTRELVVPRTPYIIVYRAMPTSAEIVTVFHAARRWPKRL